ncbi:MAG: UbiA family prenyltransferase [Flavobacteriales bacterium]
MKQSARTSFLEWGKLTRPWNVLAMGTMVLLVLRWMNHPLESLLHLGRAGWIVVPMLVGAAGNLINDYFDVREDRINKPERALVGRTVKRRVVVVTHWGFTVAALCWSGWLSSSISSSWPLVVVAAFSLILYFYSPVLKGRGAWGNVAISLCVGGMVLWGGLAAAFFAENWSRLDSAWVSFGLVLTGLNFLREWVKDLQDAEGDRAAGHQTLAARLTTKQTKLGLFLFLFAMLALGTWWAMDLVPWGWKWVPWMGCAPAAMHRTVSQNYKSLSAWLKVLMGSWFVFLI